MRGRRGFTLVEMTLAVTLAAVFGVIVAPMVLRIAHQRQVLLQEQFALTQLSNIVDELSACDTDALPERVSALQRAGIADGNRLLPHAELSIALSELDGAPPGRQFTCRLSWVDRSGNRSDPLIVSGWNYAEIGGRP